jgi:hypothetical protein
MAVNSLFHTSNSASTTAEKNLYSNLIKEAIQIFGHDVYYMDRTLVAEDMVLGEDHFHNSKLNIQSKCTWKMLMVVLLVRKS